MVPTGRYTVGTPRTYKDYIRAERVCARITRVLEPKGGGSLSVTTPFKFFGFQKNPS